LQIRASGGEDLRAAVDYLAAHASVDTGRIYGLGVCQGVNWMIEATTQDARIRRLAIVAGHYLMPETARMYLGSPQEVDGRLTLAKAAKIRYEQTGQVDYIPIVGDRRPQRAAAQQAHLRMVYSLGRPGAVLEFPRPVGKPDYCHERSRHLGLPRGSNGAEPAYAHNDDSCRPRSQRPQHPEKTV